MIRKQKNYFLVLLLMIVFTFCGCKAEKSKTKTSATTKRTSEKTEKLVDKKNTTWKKETSIKQAKESKLPTLVVTNGTIEKDGTSIIKVCIINNPGILGMSFTVAYDSQKIDLIQVDNGEAFEPTLSLTRSKTLKNGCKFMWTGEEIQKKQIKDGPVLYMKFKIKNKKLKMKTPIIVVADKKGIYDNDLSSIKVNVKNGYISTTK